MQLRPGFEGVSLQALLATTLRLTGAPRIGYTGHLSFDGVPLRQIDGGVSSTDEAHVEYGG